MSVKIKRGRQLKKKFEHLEGLKLNGSLEFSLDSHLMLVMSHNYLQHSKLHQVTMNITTPLLTTYFKPSAQK